MMCPVCKHGRMLSGRVTVTLERDSVTIVFKNVPASICENCGEEFLEDQVTSRLMAIADDAATSGVVVDIRQYKAA